MVERAVRIRRGIGLAALAPLLAAAALGIGAEGARAQTFKMKLAIVVANDPLHAFIRAYKNEIEKRTRGRIKAELYPAAQLGKIPRLIEGLQLGTVELFATPPGFLIGVDRRFQAIEVPGIFDSLKHAHATITDPDFRTPFLDIGVKKGIRGVSFWVYGPTSYATMKPVRRLEDFRGRKFRVLATKVETGVMAKLGAAGVPMAYTEVLPALQRGMLDGVRSNIVVMAATKFYTVSKSITVVNDTYIPVVGFVSMAWYRRLPEDLRKAVDDAGRALESRMFKVSQDFASRAEKIWKDNGAEVIYLSKDDKAEFMKRVAAVGEEVLGSQATIKPLYELLKRTAAKHRR